MKIKMTALINGDYFRVNALSKSFLSAFYISPAHAVMQKESASLSLGTLAHEYFLEPEKFREKYIFTSLNLATKEGKKFKDENKNKIIFKEKDLTILENLKINLLKTSYENKKFEEIIQNSIKEQGILANLLFKEKSFKLKIKPDFFLRDKNQVTIFDLKTINNMKNVYYDCRDYFYDWQSELYQFVLGFHYGLPTKFIFVFLETKPPYGIQKIEIDSFAMPEIENTIRKYFQWVSAGKPAEIYDEKIKTIKIRR